MAYNVMIYDFMTNYAIKYEVMTCMTFDILIYDIITYEVMSYD